MQAAVELGPVTVAIDAGSIVFQHYKRGIFDHAERCGTELNHAVTVVGYSNMDSDSTPYWIVRNSWGADWGEDGYIRMAIQGGDGMCGINMETTFPNIYYLSIFDQSIYMAMCIIGIILSMWPLFKLSWCKNEELLYLHEGQKGLIRVAYSTLAFYIIAIILFSISLSPPPLPTWMLYRSGIFLLYGAIHTFLCLLHFYMGMVDRLDSNSIRGNRGFSYIKTIIFTVIVCVLAITAFIMLLIENKGVASYDDEDDLKFDRRHSVS